MTLDLLSKLERLTRLREQDILTEAEFISHKEALFVSNRLIVRQATCQAQWKYKARSIELYVLSGLVILGILVSIDEAPPARLISASASAKVSATQASAPRKKMVEGFISPWDSSDLKRKPSIKKSLPEPSLDTNTAPEAR